jgi:hypothetical protein
LDALLTNISRTRSWDDVPLSIITRSILSRQVCDYRLSVTCPQKHVEQEFSSFVEECLDIWAKYPLAMESQIFCHPTYVTTSE